MILSPRSIEVTWDPPLANVDALNGYIISYDGVEGFADGSSGSVSTFQTRATIDGLEEFANYDISVEAVYGRNNVPSNAVRVMTWSDSK